MSLLTLFQKIQPRLNIFLASSSSTSRAKFPQFGTTYRHKNLIDSFIPTVYVKVGEKLRI